MSGYQQRNNQKYYKKQHFKTENYSANLFKDSFLLDPWVNLVPKEKFDESKVSDSLAGSSTDVGQNDVRNSSWPR